MQHPDCEPAASVELTEHQATWIQHFAEGQAASGGPWASTWAEIGQAAGQGLERLCRARQAERATAFEQDDIDGQYESFLEIVLNGHHPDCCHVTWNGQFPQCEFNLNFDDRAPNETLRSKRERAWRELRRVRGALRRWVEIDVLIRHRKPNYAVVRVRPEAMGLFRFGTAPLQDLAESK